MTKKGPPIRRTFLGAAYKPSRVPHPRASKPDDELAALRTRLDEVEARYARAEKAIELADDQLTELAEIVYQYVDPFDVAPEHVDAVRRATALAQTKEPSDDG